MASLLHKGLFEVVDDGFSKGDQVQLGDGSEGTILNKVERKGFSGFNVKITDSIDESQIGIVVGASPTGMKKISGSPAPPPLFGRGPLPDMASSFQRQPLSTPPADGPLSKYAQIGTEQEYIAGLNLIQTTGQSPHPEWESLFAFWGKSLGYTGQQVYIDILDAGAKESQAFTAVKDEFAGTGLTFARDVKRMMEGMARLRKAENARKAMNTYRKGDRFEGQEPDGHPIGIEIIAISDHPDDAIIVYASGEKGFSLKTQAPITATEFERSLQRWGVKKVLSLQAQQEAVVDQILQEFIEGRSYEEISYDLDIPVEEIEQILGAEFEGGYEMFALRHPKLAQVDDKPEPASEETWGVELSPPPTIEGGGLIDFPGLVGPKSEEDRLPIIPSPQKLQAQIGTHTNKEKIASKHPKYAQGTIRRAQLYAFWSTLGPEHRYNLHVVDEATDELIDSGGAATSEEALQWLNANYPDIEIRTERMANRQAQARISTLKKAINRVYAKAKFGTVPKDRTNIVAALHLELRSMVGEGYDPADIDKMATTVMDKLAMNKKAQGYSPLTDPAPRYSREEVEQITRDTLDRFPTAREAQAYLRDYLGSTENMAFALPLINERAYETGELQREGRNVAQFMSRSK